MYAPGDGMFYMTADEGSTNAIKFVSTTGGFTVDAETSIILDANGGNTYFKDDGTTYGSVTNNSGGLIINSGSTAISSYDSSGDFTGGRIVQVMPMGISNLQAGLITHFSWTDSGDSATSTNNHRMLAPYAGKIILATFVVDDGITDSIGSFGAAGAVFSIGKSTAMTTATTYSTTHTDTAGVWARESSFGPGGLNPDFGRGGPVEDWAGFSWDAGDVIEAKLVPSSSSGANGERGTMSMVIQWEA